MKRTFSVVSALVALVVVLAGCDEKKDDTPPEVAAASPTTSTISEATTTTPVDETPVPAADETSSVPQPEITPMPEGVEFDVARIFQKLAPYAAQGLNDASFGASSAYVLGGPMLVANCPAQEGVLPRYGSGKSWALICNVPNGLAAVAQLDDGALLPETVTCVLLGGVALNRNGNVYSYDIYDEAGIQLTAEGVGGLDNYDALAYWALDAFTTNYLGGKSLQEFMAP